MTQSEQTRSFVRPSVRPAHTGRVHSRSNCLKGNALSCALPPPTEFNNSAGMPARRASLGHCEFSSRQRPQRTYARSPSAGCVVASRRRPRRHSPKAGANKLANCRALESERRKRTLRAALAHAKPDNELQVGPLVRAKQSPSVRPLALLADSSGSAMLGASCYVCCWPAMLLGYRAAKSAANVIGSPLLSRGPSAKHSRLTQLIVAHRRIHLHLYRRALAALILKQASQCLSWPSRAVEAGAEAKAKATAKAIAKSNAKAEAYKPEAQADATFYRKALSARPLCSAKRSTGVGWLATRDTGV